MYKNKAIHRVSVPNTLSVNKTSYFLVNRNDIDKWPSFYSKISIEITLFVLLAFLLPSTASAGKWQTQESIIQTVSQFLEANVTDADAELKVGRIDNRLRLILCEKKLQAFLPERSHLGGKGTVGVRCTGNKPWTMYVPTQVIRYSNVLVPTHPLPRGYQIELSDLKIARIKIGHSGGKYLLHPKYAVGKILKRNISAGKPLYAHWLQAPRLIKRGQEVVLLAITSSIQVRMSGKALADGAKGDLIQVRNNASKQIVEGKVTSAGVVQVKM